MSKIILSDFSRVVIDLKPQYSSNTLNGFWDEVILKQPNADPLEYYVLNQELIGFYREISPSVMVYVCTDGRLHTLPPIAKHLEGIFAGEFRGDLKFSQKSSEDYYHAIINKLSVDPKDIIFVDDKEAHIIAAKRAGITGVLHKDTATTIARLRALLSDE